MSAMCMLSRHAAAQGIANEGEAYYVTIGVYRPMHYAVSYTAFANGKGFSASYGINERRNLYYVYLFSTTDRKRAWVFLNKLRIESEFKDAWVFTGKLGGDQITTAEEKPVAAAKEERKPVQEEKAVVKEEKQQTNSEIAQKAVVAEEVKPVVTDNTRRDSAVTAKPAEKKVAKGRFFNFEFVSKESGKPVRGEIHFLTSKHATQYQAFKANEVIDLPAPRNSDGVYKVTTVAPGYKVFETLIDYKDPEHATHDTGPDGEIIIRIELEKAKRGDYIEFNNVTFYRNSAIMQPQSKPEMEALAELMKENQAYKVRIHGHSNGNGNRDIIMLGKSTKYFESDPTNQKKSGSAMELTQHRAETAKQYLISQGISEDRIETKGEGGKMMVYPQTSVYANYNDRIEVEVIRH